MKEGGKSSSGLCRKRRPDKHTSRPLLRRDPQPDVYESQLASFKAKEIPESVLLVDAGLWRFLIAWKNLQVTRKKRLTPAEKGEANVWRWLWENVTFSLEQFAVLSGVSIKEAEGKLKMLSGNRMVYPDGSLNSYVEKLLKARVITLFKKAQTPRAKGSPKEEGSNA